MNLQQVLQEARDILISGNIEDAVLECEVLLMHVLKISRTTLHTDTECELTPAQYEEYISLVRRRLDGEPSAYITGNREFFGLDFYVTPAVLIPRPETELLVEKVISLAGERSCRTMVDVGTGSGVVAVCMALNLIETVIYATDISGAALDVALENCRRHNVEDRITLLEGDMLEPLPEPVDMIVANLPYVRKTDLQGVNTIGYEPEIALNGGGDGLQYVVRLIRQSLSKLLRGGSILLEVGEGQSEAASRQLESMYPYGDVDIFPDLAGIERVVRLTLPQAIRVDT